MVLFKITPPPPPLNAIHLVAWSTVPATIRRRQMIIHFYSVLYLVLYSFNHVLIQLKFHPTQGSGNSKGHMAHVSEYCHDAKISSTFLFCFFEMVDHFLQDFLVVHCCNGVALIYSVMIRKTLFIKENYHHNLSSTTHNFGFLWLAMSEYSIVNFVALIPVCT